MAQITQEKYVRIAPDRRGEPEVHSVLPGRTRVHRSGKSSAPLEAAADAIAAQVKLLCI